MASDALYRRFSKRVLSDYKLRRFDFPRWDSSNSPHAREGTVKLYGDHHGFTQNSCKRCDRRFDATYVTDSGPCDFHLERSKYYNRRQHPHGCCGKGKGSTGCRTAPKHVHKGNLYLDLAGYKQTQPSQEQRDADHSVYALDTESIHTVNGLEVCKITVVDTDLNIVYDKYCLPTSDIIDYNTVWSGITANDLRDVTLTFEEFRNELLELFSADTILVGHGVNHDLISLKIVHDKVVDTTDLYPHPRGPPLRRALKDIAQDELGRSIQVGEGHSSEEDAKTTMKLALRKV